MPRGFVSQNDMMGNEAGAAINTADDGEPEVVERLVANMPRTDVNAFCFSCEFRDSWDARRLQEEVIENPNMSFREKMKTLFNVYQDLRGKIHSEQYGTSPEWTLAMIKEHMLLHNPDVVQKAQHVLDEMFVMFQRHADNSVRENSGMPDPDASDRMLKYGKEIITMAKKVDEMRSLRETRTGRPLLC